jgi:ribonuclease R
MTIGLGQRVTVRLAEAVPVTGGLMLELINIDGASVPRRPMRGRGKAPVRRSAGKTKAGKAKAKRKVQRRRK